MLKDVMLLEFEEVENIRNILVHMDDVIYHIQTKEYPMESSLDIIREEVHELKNMFE